MGREQIDGSFEFLYNTEFKIYAEGCLKTGRYSGHFSGTASL